MSIFENTCRTCNNMGSQMLNIYHDKLMDGDMHIADVLNQCFRTTAAVNVSDEYPEYICYICAKKLDVTYKFLKKWRESTAEFDVALKFEHRRKRMRMNKLEADKAKSPSPIKSSSTIEEPPVVEQQMIATPPSEKEEDYAIWPLNEREVVQVDEQLLNENAIIMLEFENQQLGDPHVEEDESAPTVNSVKNEKTELPSDAHLICATCNKSFYTTRAIEMHKKLSHRNIALELTEH